MMYLFKLVFVSVALVVVPALASAQDQDTETEAVNVDFTKLAPSVWMHTSYLETEKWGKVLSHGLVVLAEDKTILVDSAWDNEQTTEVLDWAENTLKRPVTHAVFTHAHQDKMGGVPVIKERGIITTANALTNQLAPGHGLVPADMDLVFNTDNLSDDLSPLQILYPGGGHTEDNIVVWVPGAKIVFAGCLIRPLEATTLGNTADANINTWGLAAKTIAERFPDAKLIIPSHGDPAGPEILDNTIRLASEAQGE